MTPLNLDPNVSYTYTPPIDVPEWRKSLGSFAKETNALGSGLVALGAQALGATETRDQALVDYQRNMEEASSGWMAPEVGQIEDIRLTEQGGAERLGSYLGYQVPKGIAQLGSLVVGGLGTGAVTKGLASREIKNLAKTEMKNLATELATKAAVPAIATPLVEREAGKIAIKKLAERQLLGMQVGAGAGGLGMETGQIYGKLATDPTVGPEAAVAPALAYGGVAAALEYLPLHMAGKAIGLDRFLLRNVIKEDAGLAAQAAELSLKKKALGVVGKVAGTAAAGAATEGITEGLQSLVEQAATKYAQKDQQWASVLPTNKEGWSEFWNSVAAGAAVGGFAGGALGPMTGAKRPAGEVNVPEAETEAAPAGAGLAQDTQQPQGPTPAEAATPTPGAASPTIGAGQLPVEQIPVTERLLEETDQQYMERLAAAPVEEPTDAIFQPTEASTAAPAATTEQPASEPIGGEVQAVTQPDGGWSVVGPEGLVARDVTEPEAVALRDQEIAKRAQWGEVVKTTTSPQEAPQGQPAVLEPATQLEQSNGLQERQGQGQTSTEVVQQDSTQNMGAEPSIQPLLDSTQVVQPTPVVRTVKNPPYRVARTGLWNVTLKGEEGERPAYWVNKTGIEQIVQNHLNDEIPVRLRSPEGDVIGGIESLPLTANSSMKEREAVAKVLETKAGQLYPNRNNAAVTDADRRTAQALRNPQFAIELLPKAEVTASPPVITEPFNAQQVPSTSPIYEDVLRPGEQGGQEVQVPAQEGSQGVLPGGQERQQAPVASIERLESFAGPQAKTADLKLQDTAKSLVATGVSPYKAWKDTGWFQNADGGWRFELDSSKLQVKNVTANTLEEAVEYPELFAAYPQLRNLNVRPAVEKQSSYDQSQNAINLNQDKLGDASDDLLHEIQHAIQGIEGSSSGTSPKRVGQARYFRDLGEIEARNVEARKGLSASERRAIDPLSTQDIPSRQAYTSGEWSAAVGPNARIHGPTELIKEALAKKSAKENLASVYARYGIKPGQASADYANDIATPFFKERGLSLDQGHDLKLRKWGAAATPENYVDPASFAKGSQEANVWRNLQELHKDATVGFEPKTWAEVDRLESRAQPAPDPVRRAISPFEVPDTAQEPGYAYHATNQENAEAIRESGALTPFEPSYGTDQEAWPDGSTDPRSYWSENVKTVSSFAPAEGTPVVLRAKKSEVFGKEAYTGDVFNAKDVPAAELEVLTDSGWEPLVQQPATVSNQGTLEQDSLSTLESRPVATQPTVYRGSTSAAFDSGLHKKSYRKNEQLGFGIHFAEEQEVAQQYADGTITGRKGKGQFLDTATLAINSPLLADQVVAEGSPEFALAQQLAGKRLLTQKNEQGLRTTYLQNAIDMTSPQRAEKVIQEAGYDGVRYTANIISPQVGGYTKKGSSTTWIAFSPEQVKVQQKAPTLESRPYTAPEELQGADLWSVSSYGDTPLVPTGIKESSTGKPVKIKAYHGSKTGIKAGEFDQRTQSYQGFYASADRDTALGYAGRYDGGENRVYEVDIALDNPLVVDYGGKKYFGSETNRIVELAKDKGHDGVIFKNIQDPKLTTTYVVFDKKSLDSPGVMFSRTSTSTQSTTDFVAQTDSVLGQGWTQRAIDAGILVANETSPADSASGYFEPSTGKFVVNLDRTPQGQSPVGVLLHEGSHAGMARMLGGQFQGFHSDLERLAERGSNTAKQAILQATQGAIENINRQRARTGAEQFPHRIGDETLPVPERTAELQRVRNLIEEQHPGLLAEEDLAYYIQLASASPPAEAGFWRRLLAAIQAWVAQTNFGKAMATLGWRPELSPQLAVELAKQAARATLRRAELVNTLVGERAKVLRSLPAAAQMGVMEADVAETPASWLKDGKVDEAAIANTLNSLPFSGWELPKSFHTSPLSVYPEDFNTPGTFNKIFHGMVDRFNYVKDKSPDLYRAFDEWKNRQGAMQQEIQRIYLDPMRHWVSRYAPLAGDSEPIRRTELASAKIADKDHQYSTTEIIGHQLAARHILEDKVTEQLALRAAPDFLKELKKQLSPHNVGLLNAEIKVRTNGSIAIDKLSNTDAQQLFESYLPSANPKSDIGQRWVLWNRRSAGYSIATPGSKETQQDAALGFINAHELYTPQIAGREIFQRIAELSDKLAVHQLGMLQEGDLLQQADVDRLGRAYPHYVPLRREAFDYDRELAEMFEKPKANIGKLMTRDGSIASESASAVHVLQNHLAAGFTAASAAARNQMMNKFADVLYQDINGWKPWFYIKDEKVHKNDIGFIRGGKTLYIVPAEGNLRAASIIKVIAGKDAEQLSGPFTIMRHINNWVRWTNVSASPAFLLANTPRDYLTARYNLLATDAAAYAKEIGSMKNYKESYKALYKVLVQGVRETTDPQVQSWIDLVEDFEKSGGKTSFVEALKAMDGDSWKSFEAQVGRREGKKGAVVEWGRDKLEWLENLNIVLENVMRLSTYKVMRGKVGKERAAEIARNLTTNFTRKGAHIDAINTWWLFYNASVQGNWQVVQNLFFNPNKAGQRRLQKAVVGTVAFAFFIDQLGRAFSDDEDKDGISDWDSRPANDKDRKISSPFKDPITGTYLSIPAPWVFNIFWRMGGMLGEVKDGILKPQDALLDSVALTMNAMDPVGGFKALTGEGTMAQSISPTAFDPFMQMIENRDFRGNPLGPDGYPGASKRPDAYLTWDSTPEGFKTVAEFVNEVTGGSPVESGKADFRPSSYKVLWDTVWGGVGRTGWDLLGLMGSPITGAELPEAEKLPLVRTFLSAPSDSTAISLYHDRAAQVLGAKRLENLYSEGPERNPQKLAEVQQARAAVLRMVPQIEDTERQIKALRKTLRSAQARGDSRTEEQLRERIVTLQKRFNQSYSRRIGN